MENTLKFSDEFLKRRKKEYEDLNQKIRNDRRYEFRGMHYEDIIYGLFQLFSVIDFKDINESRSTGLLNVRNRNTGEIAGALYNREYIVKDVESLLLGGKEVELPCYDIEIIIKSDMVENMMPLIEALNEYCNGVDIVIESEKMPGFTIFVWKDGMKKNGTLLEQLVEEFGSGSNFVFSTSEIVTHDDQYKLKKVMAVPEN